METFNKKEYNKLWYEKNKEKHLKNMREKVECEICKCQINKSQVAVHKNTNKHLKNKIEYDKNQEIEKKRIAALEATNMLEKLYVMDSNGNMNKLTDLYKET